jgi:trans-aconitate methyltransferase
MLRTDTADPNSLPGDWDTSLYLKFDAERTRPAYDLLAQAPGQARQIVDLGCCPGTSTQLLATRFPDAQILGEDNSAQMLIEAPPPPVDRLRSARYRIMAAGAST